MWGNREYEKERRQRQRRGPMAGTFGGGATPSLFGGAATPSGANAFAPDVKGTSLFGGTPAPTTGLFGGTPAAAGGGLFGGAPATAGGGLFGGAPAPAAGLFGGAPAAVGGGLFGGAPAAAGGGLFGGAPAAAGGGLFGGAPAAAGGGLFGGAPAAAGGGLFGGAPAAAGGGLFGGAQAGGGLFGGAPAAAPGAFGASTGNLFGAAPAAAPMPSEGSMDGHIFWQWQKQMENAWNSKDKQNCSFKYIFFDSCEDAGPDSTMKVDPQKLHERRKKAREMSDNAMWERADAQNRDPSRLVPMQVTGFEELHERRRNQLKLANDIAEFNKKALAIIQTVKDERSLQIDLRFRHYVERQQMLAHRVLKLHAAIERQHINRNERYRHDGGLEPPIEIKEENDIRRLYALEHELRRPISRLHELSSRLEQEAGRDSQLDGLPPVSRLHLDSLQEWLTRQQEAVRVLIEVSLQDLKDLDVVREIVCEMTGRNP